MTTSVRWQEALADRYRVDRELGQGGMATVYLAHDVKHERDVAIKVLHPDLGAALGGERFLSEIRTTARLQHPHILPLLDSGQADGLLYYVMPLVTGETLRARLERERQLPIADAVRIARDVASALDYAHRQGVIHRDIKPENVLLHDGSALVADFGIALAVQTAGGARMTQTGLSLGTPQYMSPEQAMGERTIDARSDIYAIGAMTYEMLVGEAPFTGPSVQAIVARVLTEEPRGIGVQRRAVPVGVEQAVLRALEKLPADRFSTAAEFAAALTRDSGAPEGARPVAGATPKTSRAVLVVVGALLLAMGSAGGWFMAQRGAAPASATIARPLRLTNTGDVGCATLSPDGKEYIAVVGAYDDETRCSGRLVVRPVPTGAEQVIADDVSDVLWLEWSPKGTSLLLGGRVKGKGGVWILPRGGGQPRLLASASRSWGEFVDEATVSLFDRFNGRILQMLDAESGDVRDSLVLRTSERLLSARWSPSRRRLVVRVGGKSPGLFLMNRNGVRTDSVQIAADVGRVDWVGDDRLVFRRGAEAGIDLVMRSVDVATGRFVGREAALWTSTSATMGLSASVAGDRLLVVINAIVDELHTMRVADGNGSSRRLVRSLNAYLGNPRLSPDGTRVTYTHDDALSSNAYWVAVAGGPEHVVSSDTVPVGSTSWVDATHVLVTQGEGSASVFDLETGRRRRVQPPTGLALVGLSGGAYLWNRSADGASLVGDSTGRDGARAPIANTTGAMLSADGTRVVQIGADTNGGVRMSMFSRSSAAWSTPITLTPGDLRPVRVLDDGTVYWSRFTGQTEVWRSRGDAPPTRIASLPVHCYTESVDVSVDGSTLVCNITTQQPDAWLLQLPSAGK